MKRRLLLIALSCLLMAGSGFSNQATFPRDVVDTVLKHSVVVLAYYEVPREVSLKIVQRFKTSVVRMPNESLILPTQVVDPGGVQYLAYIGAGTILKQNHVVSVSHLFTHTDPELKDIKPIVWVLSREVDHPIRADIVRMTVLQGLRTARDTYDYSVLKLREELNFPGVKLALTAAATGDPVMFSGSVSGAAFFARFGYAIELNQFLRLDTNGSLHLAFLGSNSFLTVFPGGPGDSGGGVFNRAGELVGIMFAGMQIANEQYLFSNPVEMLMAFLVEHKLEFLAR